MPRTYDPSELLLRFQKQGILIAEALPFFSANDLRKLGMIAGERCFFGKDLKIRENGTVQTVTQEKFEARIRPAQIFYTVADQLLEQLQRSPGMQKDMCRTIQQHFKQPVVVQLTTRQQQELFQKLEKALRVCEDMSQKTLRKAGSYLDKIKISHAQWLGDASPSR